MGKTKPASQLRECYDAGHRTFGENYVQELVEKAPQMPDDTVWHFIGHLQSNKCNQLFRACPHLAMLETVDSVKLANKLNTGSQGRASTRAVLVQVNTSGEESKYGVEPDACTALAKHIYDSCPD